MNPNCRQWLWNLILGETSHDLGHLTADLASNKVFRHLQMIKLIHKDKLGIRLKQIKIE